jgi:nucleoside-diphosphate-sugar epimerase
VSSPQPLTVLLAGCGDLGTEAGLRFLAAGHRVIGVRRSGDLLPESFERQSVDLRVEGPEVPPDADVVVIAVAAGERSVEAYRATYLEGVRHVLDAIDGSGASPRVLFVSSTAVYDSKDGEWIDESTPAHGGSPTGEVLLETERVVRERSPGAIILRLGGIYGPGRERLIDQVRAGHAGIPKRSLFTNRIHRDDAAAAIVHLTTGGRNGRLVDPPLLCLGVDDEPAQLGDVVRFLAGELGVHVPAEATPATRAGGSDKRCRNDVLHSTRFEFAYPTYREGYRAILRGVGIRHP